MIKLCGFRISNYHNKVRIALMERGIPFEEDCEIHPSQKDEYVAKSPDGQGSLPRGGRHAHPRVGGHP